MTPVTLQEGWDIPSGCHPCDACEQPAGPGDAVTSVLRFGDPGLDGLGILREDLCATCPKLGELSGQDDFYWRHTIPVDGAPRLVVDYQMLREIFMLLVKREEPEYQRLAYLVGLVLLRKRLLRLKRFEALDGHEVMVVTRGAGQPEVVVPAPHLDAEALVETRERLARILQSDLPEDFSVEEILAGAETEAGEPATDDGTADEGETGAAG